MNPINMKKFGIDITNYIAIACLEKLGVTAPTEFEIEEIETIIRFYFSAQNDPENKTHGMEIRE